MARSLNISKWLQRHCVCCLCFMLLFVFLLYRVKYSRFSFIRTCKKTLQVARCGCSIFSNYHFFFPVVCHLLICHMTFPESHSVSFVIIVSFSSQTDKTVNTDMQKFLYTRYWNVNGPCMDRERRANGP